MPFLIIFGALVLITLLISFIAYKMTYYSPKKRQPPSYEIPEDEFTEHAKTFISQMVVDMQSRAFEEVTITSYDGLILYGRYYHFKDNAPILLQMHGYKSSAERDMCGGNKVAFERGYNCLIIDHRSHGKSQGTTISFGIKERKDVVSWCNYLTKRFGEQTLIAISGVSMGGATVLMASDLELPKNVIGIVGLVENMPSGSATRPGDVVTSMSGQTVEIINTDAEGRLVLADCLWFVQQQYGAKKIIDIATLTGSIEVALGGVYAGLFSNNSKLNNDLISAGQKTGELLWSMPLGKEYNKNIKSNIADMVNISKRRGDACNAASFLQKYIKDGVVWAHLDTAGVEMVNNSQSSTLKGATAFGVRLLNYFINE
jgi:pimeloyl-ACP methyl ester carboxylesterase